MFFVAISSSQLLQVVSLVVSLVVSHADAAFRQLRSSHGNLTKTLSIALQLL